MLLLSPADFLFKTFCLKKPLKNTTRVSASMDLDQARRLGLISVQIVLRLSADDILLLAKKPVEPGTLL